MSLKLINILKEEIAEQGYGHYFRDWKTSDGKKVGDTRGFDFTTNKPFDKDYKNPEVEVLPSSEEEMYSSGSLDVNLFNSKNIYKASEKRGKTYGWRGPIWSLCSPVKTGNKSPRYCDYHWHHGRDYGLATGHEIVSLVSGVVESANNWGDHVLTVKYSNGAKGRYIHCNKFFVSAGDEIKPGQVIAEVGNKGHSKGPHLHYEYYPYPKTEYTETHESVKAGKTVSATISDIDPATVDDKLFLFVKIGKESEFDKDLLKILSGGRPNNNNNNNNNNNTSSTPIYDSLPEDVKKAINKLKSDWGVEITEKHLEKEINQEGDTVKDAGSVNNEAEKEIKKLIKDCKKKYPNVAYPDDIVSGYRSYNDQVKNFGRKVKNDGRTIDDVQSYNTIPGFSQHHTGKAFDIFSTEPDWWDTNSSVKKWVSDNCENYGFKITYKVDGTLRKKEPWHLFYVGFQTDEEEEDLNNDNTQTTKGKTVVFGGMDYATAEWMKSQWVEAGLPVDKAIFLDYTSTDLSKVKKNNTIDKIVGFSAGGTDVWDEIMSNSSEYIFMGLIDPSTSESVFEKYKNGGLPSQVKSLSNSANWTGKNASIGVRLKKLEDNGVLTKTNSAHRKIPLEFFKKYKTNLS